MGTVYRGWQLSVDREVAIKVIHPRLASDRTAVKRFLREARLSSRLEPAEHRQRLRLRPDRRRRPLHRDGAAARPHARARARAGQPLPLRRAIDDRSRSCATRSRPRTTQGIIHRDLKPGNIVILDEPPGRDLVKVLDFGLAKSLVSDATSRVTQTDADARHAAVHAARADRGQPTDQRSDLYALGCILLRAARRDAAVPAREHAHACSRAHMSEPPPALPPTCRRARRRSSIACSRRCRSSACRPPARCAGSSRATSMAAEPISAVRRVDARHGHRRRVGRAGLEHRRTAAVARRSRRAVARRSARSPPASSRSCRAVGRRPRRV